MNSARINAGQSPALAQSARTVHTIRSVDAEVNAVSRAGAVPAVAEAG